MSRLQLLLPEDVDKEALFALREEFMALDPEGLESDLYDTPDLDLWLERQKQNRQGKGLLGTQVPHSTFVSVRLSDGLPIGLIDIRHRLNERLLQLGGNIGYCVRPTQRRQGYGKEQLTLALDFCRQQGLDLCQVQPRLRRHHPRLRRPFAGRDSRSGPHHPALVD